MKKLAYIIFLSLISSLGFSQGFTNDSYKGSATGTNSYSVTINAITYPSIYDGQMITVEFVNGNTTAATLKVSGGGSISYAAKNITKNGSALSSGDISAGVWYTMKYNASSSDWQIVGADASIGDAAADGVTKGKATFTAADFNSSSGVISIDYANGQAATAGQDGFLQSADWTTFNNKLSTITVGTTTITSGTSGAIPFNGAGVYQEDATQLFWDNTNNRLGIGTNSPANELHIELPGFSDGIRLTKSGDNMASLFATSAKGGRLNLFNTSGTVVAAFNTDASDDFINTGNLFGIGISSPSAKLHVQGTGTTSATFDFIVHNASGSSNSMKIRGDGYVGIGTASPNTRLNIVDSIGAGFYIEEITNKQNGATTFSGTKWNAPFSPVGGAGFGFIRMGSQAGTGVFDIGNTTNWHNDFYTNNTLRMRMHGTNGTVGIGTGTGAHSGQLHVIAAGNTSAGYFAASGTASAMVIRENTSSAALQIDRDATTSEGSIQFSDNTSAVWLMGQRSSGTANSFAIYNYGRNNQDFTILNSSGFFGINQTTPTARFHLSAGKARFEDNDSGSGVVVKNTDGTLSASLSVLNNDESTGMSILSYGTASGTPNRILFSQGHGKNLRWAIGSSPIGDWGVFNSDLTTAYLTVNNTGYVGVGTMLAGPDIKFSIANTQTAVTTFHADGGGDIKIEYDGRIYGTAIHNNSGSVSGTTNQYFASGTYTATLTNTTNISASTPFKAQWTRVGNVVIVSGKVDIDITTTLLASELGMSLPIASDFTAEEDCGGSATDGTVQDSGIRILADATNNRAQFSWAGQAGTGNLSYSFQFQYEIK